MTEPNVMGRTKVSLSRILSLLLASVYVIAALTWGTTLWVFLKIALACGAAVACIWIPETMVEMPPLKPTRFTTSAPELVRLLGWIILLLPLAVAAYWYFTGSLP